MRGSLAIVGVLGLLVLGPACGEESSAPAGTDPAAQAEAALPDGWIGALVAAPDDFAATVDGPDREAWVALHGGDLVAASAAADPVLSARAWQARADLHEDLAHLGAWTWQALSTEWVARDPALADGPLPLLAGLALADVGAADAARRQVAALDPTRQRLVEAVLVPVVAAGDAPPPPPAGVAGGVAGATLDSRGCLAAHLDLRADRLAALPEPCADGGPLALADADGRVFQDPLLHGALARQAASAAREARGGGSVTEALPPTPGLPHLLFGGWWTAADLRADLAGAPSPSLAGLALPPAGDADDPQAARERARALDAALDAWVRDRRGAASAEGQALLADLRLVEQLRAHTLIRWARAALRAERPRQALAWLELAHDADDPRAVGVVNRPSLFALLAEARARTGRTREALDALGPLRDSVPGVRGLAETLGDLVVLQTMDRQGDSKEL